MASAHNKRKIETNAENPTSDFGYGDIVFANFGKDAWWPGMVTKGKDIGHPKAEPNRVWILWFGDNTVSQIFRKNNLMDFKSFVSKKKRPLTSKMMLNNLRWALKEMISRLNLTINTDIVQWAKNGFELPKDSLVTEEELGKGPRITERTQKILDDLKTRKTSKETQKSNLPTKRKNDDEVKNNATKKGSAQEKARKKCSDNEESALEKVRNGSLNIKEICIACDSLEARVVIQHPIMEGGVCQNCKDHLTRTFFTEGSDGLYTNCMLCSLEGSFVICDEKECNRSYCTECIEMLVSPDAVQNVKNSDPWRCYVCTPYKKNNFGLIKIKENWRSNITNLYERTNKVEIHSQCIKNEGELTVLSVFDGIGTGRMVLGKLDIKIKKYYAFEKNKDVTKMDEPYEIHYLGDVTNFKDSMIQKIGPIDLLIGGSSFSDKSPTNPDRKGNYDSSGALFFYFFKIFKAVQCENEKSGRKLHWLFQKVASLPIALKEDIGNMLESEPVLIFPKHFTAQQPPRFYFGNVASLYVPIQTLLSKG